MQLIYIFVKFLPSNHGRKLHSIASSPFNFLQYLQVWPNGKALDYESRDSRFDPWHDHTLLPILITILYIFWRCCCTSRSF